MNNDYTSRTFFNILGGSLTLLSVQLPWMTVFGTPITIQAGGIYAVMFYWALGGAVLSFLSRYGGALTFVGLLAFFGEPYVSYGVAFPGFGVLVAFFGMILTFAGVRWSIPSGLVKGREILGGVLYSVGFLIVLTLIVGSFVYGGIFSSGASELVVAAPLLIVGVLLTGLGLKLFLAREANKRSLGVLSSAA